jgi:hypothetical protein
VRCDTRVADHVGRSSRACCVGVGGRSTTPFVPGTHGISLATNQPQNHASKKFKPVSQLCECGWGRGACLLAKRPHTTATHYCDRAPALLHPPQPTPPWACSATCSAGCKWEACSVCVRHASVTCGMSGRQAGGCLAGPTSTSDTVKHPPDRARVCGCAARANPILPAATCPHCLRTARRCDRVSDRGVLRAGHASVCAGRVTRRHQPETHPRAARAPLGAWRLRGRPCMRSPCLPHLSCVARRPAGL